MFLRGQPRALIIVLIGGINPEALEGKRGEKKTKKDEHLTTYISFWISASQLYNHPSDILWFYWVRGLVLHKLG